jgi:DNA-binding transcriptional ArsR family regulator
MTDADRTDVFRGMAHPLRRRVLRRLAEGETGVAELRTIVQVTPQALSRHLAILRETGLVTARLARPHRFYRLRDNAFQRARGWVNGLNAAASTTRSRSTA